MRLLGVDYGTKRIGLAIGETSPFFVEPLTTVHETDYARAAQMVAEIAKEEGAELLVIGIPVALKGHEQGETSEQVHIFIPELKKKTNLEIVTEDERMTTALADKIHRQFGTSKKSKFERDAVAAAIMLETYIERMSP
jgi:putative holliday junction resolvase